MLYAYVARFYVMENLIFFFCYFFGTKQGLRYKIKL